MDLVFPPCLGIVIPLRLKVLGSQTIEKTLPVLCQTLITQNQILKHLHFFLFFHKLHWHQLIQDNLQLNQGPSMISS